jgi:hypothetical protein
MTTYTAQEIIESTGITQEDLNLFIGGAPYSGDDMLQIDEARTEAINKGMSIGDFLKANPNYARLSNASIGAGGAGQSNQSGYSFQDVLNQQVRSSNGATQVGAVPIAGAQSAAVGLATAMAAQTIQQASQMYHVLLEQTLNGQFSDNPEISALQVAMLQPLVDVQGDVQAGFFQALSDTFSGVNKQDPLKALESGMGVLLNVDRNNPLSLLPAQTQPQLNASSH